VAGTCADGDLSAAGGDEIVDDAMAETALGGGRKVAGIHKGCGDGWRDAGAVIFDDELETACDDAKGDADFAMGVGGWGGSALLFADGFDGVANQIDGDALDGFGGKSGGRHKGGGEDGDSCGAGGDAFKDRCEIAQD
jgi:hypothetical protein